MARRHPLHRDSDNQWLASASDCKIALARIVVLFCSSSGKARASNETAVHRRSNVSVVSPKGNHSVSGVK
jgi:hypothetical protein